MVLRRLMILLYCYYCEKSHLLFYQTPVSYDKVCPNAQNQQQNSRVLQQRKSYSRHIHPIQFASWTVTFLSSYLHSHLRSTSKIPAGERIFVNLGAAQPTNAIIKFSTYCHCNKSRVKIIVRRYIRIHYSVIMQVGESTKKKKKQQQ